MSTSLDTRGEPFFALVYYTMLCLQRHRTITYLVILL